MEDTQIGNIEWKTVRLWLKGSFFVVATTIYWISVIIQVHSDTTKPWSGICPIDATGLFGVILFSLRSIVSIYDTNPWGMSLPKLKKKMKRHVVESALGPLIVLTQIFDDLDNPDELDSSTKKDQ